MFVVVVDRSMNSRIMSTFSTELCTMPTQDKTRCQLSKSRDANLDLDQMHLLGWSLDLDHNITLDRVVLIEFPSHHFS